MQGPTLGAEGIVVWNCIDLSISSIASFHGPRRNQQEGEEYRQEVIEDFLLALIWFIKDDIEQK